MERRGDVGCVSHAETDSAYYLLLIFYSLFIVLKFALNISCCVIELESNFSRFINLKHGTAQYIDERSLRYGSSQIYFYSIFHKTHCFKTALQKIMCFLISMYIMYTV